MVPLIIKCFDFIIILISINMNPQALGAMPMGGPMGPAG
jgi:hypothetical protein